jgi:amidohydrolase
MTTTDSIAARADAIAPGIADLRHELHQHPEIRFEEHWTSDRVAQFLTALNVPHTRGHAKGTGIVATLEGSGDKTVLLRADIDALEIQEETGLPYASKIPNRMHACGHDGHTASLCGVIQLLSGMRDALPGTIKFVFQPAEEIAAGGRYIVEEGVLDDVDAAFALHGWPTIPVGQIGLRPGPMLAGADNFEIEVVGKGCHAAAPHNGVDPIVVAAHITTALQTIVSREVDPLDASVVSVTIIHGGAASNVVSDRALMEGTFRALNKRVRDEIATALVRVAQEIARAFRAEARVTILENAYPPLINDPDATEFVFDTARDVLGASRCIEMERPFMGAEDFAFYLEKAPGAFICLGVNPSETEPYPALHNAKYDFNDNAIPTAITLMSNLALRSLTRV